VVKAVWSVVDRLDAALRIKAAVLNSDILRSYLGLLVQGKIDSDAIENFRGEKLYKQALGIALLPSSPTLRHRLDNKATEMFDFVPPMIETLLAGERPEYFVLACGWLPLDVDTFAMDNGGTAWEGVGRTYAGVDGYCPLAAYLGSHGFCLVLALRPGVQHSASETDFNLERVIPMAQRLSATGPNARILARLDSGFDSAKLVRGILACNGVSLPQVDSLIKWNPRTTDMAALATRLDADNATHWEHPGAGKRMTVREEFVTIGGVQRSLRRVIRLSERAIDPEGQALLVPELELDGWTTSLPAQLTAQDIIALYPDQGKHEQFHSEFKTDLDLTRLPSGKFGTNYLAYRLAALAMDIPRLIGQRGLRGPDAAVRHSAKRRRVKTVMQALIYRAGRLVAHGRLILGLGANDRSAAVFTRLHAQFAAPM